MSCSQYVLHISVDMGCLLRTRAGTILNYNRDPSHSRRMVLGRAASPSLVLAVSTVLKARTRNGTMHGPPSTSACTAWACLNKDKNSLFGGTAEAYNKYQHHLSLFEVSYTIRIQGIQDTILAIILAAMLQGGVVYVTLDVVTLQDQGPPRSCKKGYYRTSRSV